MSKIGDVYSGGSKIGELHPGNGGGGLCLLLIFGIILLPIVGVVAGIYTVGHNIQQTNDAHSTATAWVPILAQSDYYSTRASVIKVKAPVNPHTHKFSDGSVVFSFDIIFSNSDTKPHDVTVHYSYNLQEYIPSFGFSKNVGADEKADFQLRASGNTGETITYQSNNGDPLSNFRSFSLELLTMDDEPIVDPRVALSHLSFTAHGSPISPQDTDYEGVDCSLTVKNADSVSHGFTINSDYTYTYSDDAGHIQTGYDSGSDYLLLPGHNSKPADLPLSAFNTDYYPGNHLLTLTLTDIKITMDDPGDNNVPPQILSKSFKTTACDLK